MMTLSDFQKLFQLIYVQYFNNYDTYGINKSFTKYIFYTEFCDPECLFKVI